MDVNEEIFYCLDLPRDNSDFRFVVEVKPEKKYFILSYSQISFGDNFSTSSKVVVKIIITA